MTHAITTRYSYTPETFNKAHDVALYPSGYMAHVDDISSDIIKVFIYIKSTVTLPAYTPVQIQGNYVAEAIGPSTSHVRVVVPQFAINSGQYGFFQYQGECNCYVKTYSTGMAINDYLKSDDDFPFEIVRTGPNLDATSLATSLFVVAGSTTTLGPIILMGRDNKTST